MAEARSVSKAIQVFRGAAIACGAAALILLFARLDFIGVGAAIRDIGAVAFLGALAFSLGGMAAMGFYDVLALRTVARGRVSDALAWRTGVKAYGISNLLGFAMLTGGAVRYPVYRARGVDVGELSNAMGLSWAAFWLAVMGVAGMVLTLHPVDMAGHFRIAPALLRGIGIAALVVTAGILALIAKGMQVLRVGRWTVLFPEPRLALAQMAVALAELSLAAAALYIILPATADLPFAAFFGAYVLAVGVGLISHSPGGLGAFEATLLLLTGLPTSPQIVAALLGYRLVRFLIPFALACLWLLWDWGRARRQLR